MANRSSQIVPPRPSRGNVTGTILILLQGGCLLLAAQLIAMKALYPRHLAGLAPDARALLPAVLADALPENADSAWKWTVTAFDLLGVLLMGAVWLLWRQAAAHGRGTHTEASSRAAVTARLCTALIALIELLLCAALLLIGLVSLKQPWTAVIAWLTPVLAVPVGWALMRFGAPGVISGKHAHFARLI